MLSEDSLSIVCQDKWRVDEMRQDVQLRSRQRNVLLITCVVAVMLFPVFLVNFLPGKSVLAVIAALCIFKMHRHTQQMEAQTADAEKLEASIKPRVRSILRLSEQGTKQRAAKRAC